MADEREFDRMMEEELTQLPPPERAIEEITPWRRAVSRIVWGLGLTTFTLNIGYLDDILAVVGLVLVYLGFRTLRRENRWFTACWVISLLRMVLCLTAWTVYATIWSEKIGQLPVGVAGILLSVVQLFCLWRGIKAVRRAAGQESRAGAAAALMAFEAAALGLALAGAGGWLLVGALGILYCLILVSLAQVPALLDDAEYQVSVAPVWLSERSVWLCWLCAIIVCVPLAGLLWGHYPMNWTPRAEKEQAGLEEVRANLLELGIPDDVLDDLTGDELAELKGALWAEVSVDKHSYSEYAGSTAYDVQELKVTSIAVELPGDHWKVIHHFLWQADPPVWGGTECMKIWPACLPGLDGWRPEGEPTGCVLYDKDGTTYTADFYYFGERSYSSDSMFFDGQSNNTSLFAAFSLPAGEESRRGYVIYGMEKVADGWILNSIAQYTHQVKKINYPLMTALQYDMSGIWNGFGAFYRSFNAIQCFPDRSR